jgi:two-component system, LytTR family, response regulator
VLRVLIVDDEAPARARLRQMLAAHSGVEIVAEAETGVEAMGKVAEFHPDLLLLDIQMPGSTGIDVASSLPEPRPFIVFCTAYDQHAVDAFELHAVDYLLKPISRARLAQALERVTSLSAAEHHSALNQVTRVPQAAAARFLVKNAGHYLVVGEARVLYFDSEDGLTRLVTDKEKYWMDPTLNELEERLQASRFFRISRAAIINLNAVAEVHPMPGGSGTVLMKNGEQLEVSRRRFRELLDALGG